MGAKSRGTIPKGWKRNPERGNLKGGSKVGDCLFLFLSPLPWCQNSYIRGGVFHRKKTLERGGRDLEKGLLRVCTNRLREKAGD